MPGNAGRLKGKGLAMEETKYEVEVSLLLKGAFTVAADDESCAEEVVNLMLAAGRIKLSDLEPAETWVDCIGEADEDAEPMNGDGAEDGEAGDDSPGYVYPLSQRPCGQECSTAEKAGCGTARALRIERM